MRPLKQNPDMETEYKETINVKNIVFGKKEHTTILGNGSLGFIETLHKQ